jgi:tight adherence protein B
MSEAVTAFLLSVCAGYGVFLVYTAYVFRWRGLGVSPAVVQRGSRQRLQHYLVQAGLERTRPVEFVAVSLVLLVVAGAFGYAIWGSAASAVVVAGSAALIPAASARARRRGRREQAREAWPRMIEEIRLQAVTLGRSIPQALLGVGLNGPEEMRSAFVAAQREWLMSTDFVRTLDVLKRHLADPTADAVCETLLVAHDIGGTDVDQRLRALIEDRIQDVQGRKDARSKQAGVRFARLFVLVVPVGMALVGLSIGDGRAAYQSLSGQIATLAAFGLIGLCWLWAGYLLRLPEEQRVFVEEARGGAR